MTCVPLASGHTFPSQDATKTEELTANTDPRALQKDPKHLSVAPSREDGPGVLGSPPEGGMTKGLTFRSSSWMRWLSCFTLVFPPSDSAISTRFFLDSSTILVAMASPAIPAVPKNENGEIS